jgi:hypothetical protein
VDEIAKYKECKANNERCQVVLTDVIDQAVEELKTTEPLLHSFAIPNNSDLKEYLLNGREGGRIPSSKFPTSTQFLENIGAKDWFNESKAKEYKSKKKDKKDQDEAEDVECEDETNIEEEDKVSIAECNKNHGVYRDDEVLPTMNLKVIDIRPGGVHPVYDIQVDKEESFLANGIVAHNCMIAHGALGFLKERMMDVSDIFTIYICQECGLFSVVNPDEESGIRTCTGCDKYSQFMELRIPYACKLLMQELEGMMITPRFKVNN